MSSAAPSSSVIELPRSVLRRRARRGAAAAPKRIMPFVYVHCPEEHVLRMSAEAISGGRECFCPHCRRTFRPGREEVERAEEHLEVGTRARSPLPRVMAGARYTGATVLPLSWRTALRRAWRRVLRLFT